MFFFCCCCCYAHPPALNILYSRVCCSVSVVNLVGGRKAHIIRFLLYSHSVMPFAAFLEKCTTFSSRADASTASPGGMVSDPCKQLNIKTNPSLVHLFQYYYSNARSGRRSLFLLFPSSGEEEDAGSHSKSSMQ